jgi:hypothetical protein
MAFHIFLFLLVICLLLTLALLWCLGWLHLQPSHSAVASRRSPVHRLLKPRSPDDCPACRLASLASSGVEPASAPVRPWREVKSRRGAPKRVNSEGFACPNRTCPYSGITDADIHASFWGWQAWLGRAHPNVSRSCLPHHVQCPAPHAIVSFENPFPLRRHGAVSAGRRVGSLGGLACVRLSTRHHHEPFCPERARTHKPCTSGPFAISSSRTSNWTNCEPGSAALHRCSGSGWLSTLARALLPVLELGPRTQHMAHRVIHSLRQLLAPGCLPLFPSDGLNLSFSALTAHFGTWREERRRGRNVRRWQVAASLIYGQVKKCYRQRKLVRVTHVMRLGTEDALKAALQGLGFSGRLNTACIERAPLTFRHGCSALARRTWATSQQASQLLAHLEWWRAYYHVVRPHAALREALAQPRERGGTLLAQRYRQRTPAMAAGRTNRRWTAREVLSCPLPKVSA